MTETRNIVILGGSFAGINSAHYFLRHVYPRLPTDEKITYRLLLVDPSEKFYFRPAAPRGVVSGELMPDASLFHDRQQGFTQYGDKYSFIHGSATSWDPEERSVTIRLADGTEEALPYHALILATGSKSHSPLFSLQGGAHSDIQAALHAARAAIANAKRVVVAGGGATGVETAGEIGEQLNGAAGCFSSRPANPHAEITLYTNASQLLPGLRPAIAQQAETYLRRVGVDVQYQTKIASTELLPNGQTKVVLHSGEAVVADVYIAAVGTTPAAGYAPAGLLDAQGYVRANGQTTRVDGAGARVYALGDVASYSRNSILDLMGALPVLQTNLARDLLAEEEGPDREFVPNETETQLVPIGLSKGVGAVFGWRLPSWAVWLIKGRDYLSSHAADTVFGKQVLKESAWKAKST